MYLSFCKAIVGLSVTSDIYKLIDHEDKVSVDKLSDDYTKIHNARFSMYFKNNKVALITKQDEIQNVFYTVDDAIKVLFATTDL